MRIVDLFCGIGGVAEAAQALEPYERDECLADPTGAFPRVVAAIDIDRRIVPIYRANHRVEPSVRAIESIRQIPEADLWWLSPPCQPYTRRGQGRGEQDARSAGLERIIALLQRERPKGVMLENVPEFLGSPHHRELQRRLNAAGYSVCVDELCPTQWKVPMRRPRAYLRARRDGIAIPPVTTENLGRPLPQYLDAASWDDPALRVPETLACRFERAMHVVDVEDEQAIAACFTSAYGKSPVRAGSYLRSERHDWLRRFSPQEVGRLMGYREGFWWPEDLNTRARYHLLGNALSVTVVRALLSTMQHLG